MQRLFTRLLAAGLAALPWAGIAAAQTPLFPPDLERPSDDVLEAVAASDGIVAQLELPVAPGQPFAFEVFLDGAVQVVTMRPHSVLSPDYRLMVQRPDGTYEEEPAPPSTTYRGSVDGYPESIVAASLLDGQLSAVVELVRGEPLWGIQPLSEIRPGEARERHVVFSTQDAIPVAGWCGTTEALRVMPLPGGAAASSEDAGEKIAEIACDADVEFFQKNGSSVSNTQADITNIINATEAIYQQDTGILYEITVIYVETTEPDPYSSTSASTLLSQFRNHWNSFHGADPRDVAHLFTGKNLSGSVIGVAYLNVICNIPMAYGLSQSKFTFSMPFRTALTAHELGHNWNAGHCNGHPDCRIMCSGLGGCTGTITSFGSPSKNSINNKKASSGCLDDAPPPAPPTIASISPDSVKAFGAKSVTLTGSSFTGVTQVDVGSQTLVPPFGAIVVDDSTLELNAPQPTALGTVQVTATNAAGTSNPVNLTYVATDPPQLSTPSFGVSGASFGWSFGAQPDDLWFLFIAFDGSSLPFLGFDVLVNLVPVTSGTLSAVGVGSHSTTAPSGLAGTTVWSQVGTADLSTGGFSGATNITSATFLF